MKIYESDCVSNLKKFTKQIFRKRQQVYKFYLQIKVITVSFQNFSLGIFDKYKTHLMCNQSLEQKYLFWFHYTHF